MSNGLNALIARGGTQVASPIARYQQTRKDVATERRNALAERQAELGMRSTRQQMGQSAQNQKIKQAEAFGKSVTPIIESVNRAPDKQAAWMTARPQVEQMAATMGIDVPPGSMDAWNQQQADSLISRFGSAPAKAPTTRTVMEGQEKVQQEWQPATKTWKEVGRGVTSQISGTREQVMPTKKVTGDIQKKVLNTEDFLDDMSNLSGVLDQTAPMAQTWGGDLSDAALQGLSRTFGIEFEGDVEQFRKNKQNVRNFTRKISDSYRKMITGSQANKYELKRIEGQMPNEKDDWNTLRTKIKTLSGIAEISNVRSKMAMSQGFSYVGRRDDGSLIYSKQGKNYKVGDIPTLGDVLSHDDMREKIALRIKGLSPNLAEAEIASKTLQEMGALGYNMRRYR